MVLAAPSLVSGQDVDLRCFTFEQQVTKLLRSQIRRTVQHAVAVRTDDGQLIQCDG